MHMPKKYKLCTQKHSKNCKCDGTGSQSSNSVLSLAFTTISNKITSEIRIGTIQSSKNFMNYPSSQVVQHTTAFKA